MAVFCTLIINENIRNPAHDIDLKNFKNYDTALKYKTKRMKALTCKIQFNF